MESNNETANISIPIIKEDSRFAFNINALNLSQTDEYVFKIVNYRDDNINTEDFSYNITIINPKNAVLVPNIKIDPINSPITSNPKP